MLGLLIGGAIIVVPVSEAIRDATDICGIARQSVACAPALTPDSDLPHRDHGPATSTQTSVITSTATSTAVTGSSR
jgi:hypothetical protein